jgi:hypothetical protein
MFSWITGSIGHPETMAQKSQSTATPWSAAGRRLKNAPTNQSTSRNECNPRLHLNDDGGYGVVPIGREGFHRCELIGKLTEAVAGCFSGSTTFAG